LSSLSFMSTSNKTTTETKPDERAGNKGANRRKQYSVAFKAAFILAVQDRRETALKEGTDPTQILKVFCCISALYRCVSLPRHQLLFPALS
jgi:hypothetical protein